MADLLFRWPDGFTRCLPMTHCFYRLPPTTRAWGLVLALLAGLAQPTLAQKVTTAPFSYLPEAGPDRYDMRVPRKTLALADGSGFVILAHQAAGAYAVERYDRDLKKQWTAAVPLAPGETLEAFGRSAQQAWVVLHHKDEANQLLTVVPVNLQTGQRGQPKVVVSAPVRDRRPGIAISPDGGRLLAFRYSTRQEQIRAMTATLFGADLKPLGEKTYNFQELGDFFSPAVQLANDGTQYVTLVSDGMQKLTVRRYPAANTADVKVLGVPVGGVYDSRKVNVRDTKFAVLDDGMLYAAALCADYATGEYYSLKAVRFDFSSGTGDMKFAPEVRFGPAYLAEVGTAVGQPVKRLEDLYLKELLLSSDKQLVVVAEKHFEEGGDTAPVRAQELHLFGYDEFMAAKWHRLLPKNQVAPAADAYTGIGFRAAVFGTDVQVLTLETLAQKSDLYLRHVSSQSGVLGTPQRLKLSVADDQQLAYVKDFTVWLDPKTLVVVSRPSKKSKALQLEKVVLK